MSEEAVRNATDGGGNDARKFGPVAQRLEQGIHG